MLKIKQQDWQAIPEQAQQEVYDFFVFVKNKYHSNDLDSTQTKVFSNHSANLIEDWKDETEDEIWQ